MAKDFSLSGRLDAIASMVGPCDTFTDIGTDHALLPIWLLKQNICKKAVAADVRPGPLRTAVKNAGEYGADERRISFILSDGLKEIDPPPDGRNVLSIAGMGGLLITDILRDGAGKLKSYESMILSPHTKQAELRKYIIGNGMSITDEKYLAEEGKLYVVIKAVYGSSDNDRPYSETEFRFGRFIDKALGDDGVRGFLSERYRELTKIIMDNPGLPGDRMEILKKEALSYREVLGI